MDKLYFLVSQSKLWCDNDPQGFLHRYFIEEGNFGTAGLIALAIAVIGAIVYYGWIGMAVPRMSNLTTWLVTLLIVGAATFGVTQAAIIGSSDYQAPTGIFKSIDEYAKERTDDPRLKDEALQRKIIDDRDRMKENLKAATNPVSLYLDLTNTVYALILFFFLSLCVKRATRYAINIPF